MEGENDNSQWYLKLFMAAGGQENAPKVLFKLQAYDWKNKEWVKDSVLKTAMTSLLALGVRHIAYYPDNVHKNRPDPEVISSILSARNEAQLKHPPPVKQPEGFFDRLFRYLFSSQP